MRDMFRRLGRIAKAELNTFVDKFNKSDDHTTHRQVDDELAADLRPESDTVTTSASTGYPEPIRRAYAALELPLGSDRTRVKTAYREMLRRYHPDRHHQDPSKLETANELTRELREAYERINDFLDE